MKIVDLPIATLHEAPWNPNEASDFMLRHLAKSLDRFGLVLPLVVRPLETDYEVLSGNQRLRVLSEQGVQTVPCVVLDLGDTDARLLAQALNAVHGEDDLTKKAALVRDLLKSLPDSEVAAILPDTAEALQGYASLGAQTPDSISAALSAWEKAREAALQRISFPFSSKQRLVIEQAIDLALPGVEETDSPHRRALALLAICRHYMATKGMVPM